MGLGTWPQTYPGGLSVDTTLDATHKNFVIDVTTGATNKTMTVPAASGFDDGTIFHLRKDDAAAGFVVLVGAFDWTLLNQDNYVAIVGDTVKWRILMRD